MGFPIPIRRHLCIESGPWFPKQILLFAAATSPLPPPHSPFTPNLQIYRISMGMDAVVVIFIRFYHHILPVYSYRFLFPLMLRGLWWVPKLGYIAVVFACCHVTPSHHRQDSEMLESIEQVNCSHGVVCRACVLNVVYSLHYLFCLFMWIISLMMIQIIFICHLILIT